MKIRFSQAIAVVKAGIPFAGCPISGASVPEKCFLDEVAAMRNLKEKDLVPVQMKKELVFVPGTPADGWQNKAAEGKKSVFKGKLDLDTLTGKKNALGTECAVYLTLTVPKDGVAVIGMGCDWFFEAYCNGTLCYSTMKTGNQSGSLPISASDCVFPIPVRKGKNLLAVRVKRGGGSWMFACAPVRKIQEGGIPVVDGKPWLGHPDTAKRSISFRTIGNVGAGVEYREKGADKWLCRWHSRLGQILQRRFHKVFLTDLKPGKTYEYRIVMITPLAPEKRFRSSAYEFTLPAADTKNFSFVFTADLQFPPAVRKTLLRNLLKHAKAAECDFFVMGGDIGSSFDPEFVLDTEFQALDKAGASGKPVVYLRGNHETRGRYADTFLDYFGTEDEKSFYVFRFGDTAFMVLDSWEDKLASTPGHNYCKYNLDREFFDAENAWFRKAVRSEAWTSAKRRIVLCHGAPWAQRGKLMPVKLRKMTDFAFRGKTPASRVHLWFAGHIHTLARAIPGTDLVAAEQPYAMDVNGLDYCYPVLIGAGPNKKGRVQASIFRVDCTEDGVTVRAYDAKGKCMDETVFPDKGGMIEKISLPKHHTQKWGK